MTYHIRVRVGALNIQNNEILLTEFDDPYRGMFMISQLVERNLMNL